MWRTSRSRNSDRDPDAAATGPEARGVAPPRAGPAAGLGVHLVARAAARRTRQDADPLPRRSGPRVHPVAGAPAVPRLVAEPVPRLASAADCVCARRSVILSAHGAASIDSSRGAGDRGHGDLAGVPACPDRHARRPRAAAREGLGLPIDLVPPRAEVRLATPPAPCIRRSPR
jgi:hypothetical protein